MSNSAILLYFYNYIFEFKYLCKMKNSKSLGLLDSVLQVAALSLEGISDYLQLLSLPLPFLRLSLDRLLALVEFASGGFQLGLMVSEFANLTRHLLLGFLGLPQGTFEVEFLGLIGLQDPLQLSLLSELYLDLSS